MVLTHVVEDNYLTQGQELKGGVILFWLAATDTCVRKLEYFFLLQDPTNIWYEVDRGCELQFPGGQFAPDGLSVRVYTVVWSLLLYLSIFEQMSLRDRERTERHSE